MIEFFKALFDSGFMPHGHCYLWQPGLLWLHAGSDALIALAYYLIPVALITFVRKRDDLAFSWMFVLFGIFIFACGTTHLINVWTIWHGTYWLSGAVKFVTAAASVGTAVMLVPLVPKALNLPSPAQLKAANEALKQEIQDRRHAEEEVRRLNRELEGRVQKRTAELERQAREMEREIEQREQADAALRESEAQFRTLIEAMPQIVWMADAHGSIDYYNHRWTDYTGVSEEDGADWGWEKVIHPDDLERTVASWSGAVKEARAHEVEHRLRRKDGVYRWYLTRGAPIMSSTGTVARWFGTSTNIHSQKLVEQELRRAKETAEAANRAKSEFLANMSHEVRTPLTGVIGLASVLERRVPDKEKELVQRISKAGRRLLDTLNSILMLARLETRDVDPITEPVMVADRAEEIVQFFRPQAEAKGLALDLSVDSDAKEAQSELDQGSLAIILQNLLSNAIKFTEGGAVQVAVQVRAQHVQIEVSDTGPGIPEDFVPDLFSPFKQASTGVRRSHEGSGLGLSITKQLIEKMGGRIEVDSKEGIGTRFTVSFPTVPKAARTDTDTEVSGVPARRKNTSVVASRILIAEDYDDAVVFLKHVLADMGEVTVTANATDAWRRAQERPYDLILLDINLEGEASGVELMHELRSTDAYRHVPMVALTAYALPGDRDALLQKGFDAYVKKPFTAEELLDTIAKVM